MSCREKCNFTFCYDLLNSSVYVQDLIFDYIKYTYLWDVQYHYAKFPYSLHHFYYIIIVYIDPYFVHLSIRIIKMNVMDFVLITNVISVSIILVFGNLDFTVYKYNAPIAFFKLSLYIKHYCIYQYNICPCV